VVLPRTVEKPLVEVSRVIVRAAQSRKDPENRPRVRRSFSGIGAMVEVLPVVAGIGHASIVKHRGMDR
jgi:hypothetical protein